MCDYCTTDRDGFVSLLPRKGTGNARIHKDAIEVSGPNWTRLSIPIDFCPKCGRRMRDEK